MFQDRPRNSSFFTGSKPEIDSPISEYPFYVALWNNGIHICGASILTKDMILTAAHCVYNIVNPSNMEAFFGVSSRDEILKKARFMLGCFSHFNMRFALQRQNIKRSKASLWT